MVDHKANVFDPILLSCNAHIYIVIHPLIDIIRVISYIYNACVCKLPICLVTAHHHKNHTFYQLEHHIKVVIVVQ